MRLVITPYDYQEEAVSSLITWLDTEKGNPLVSAPTGSGKSCMIAFLIQRLVEKYPGIRILMAVHQKELIEQNYRTLKSLWPNAPCGIYSASIGKKSSSDQIVFGQIQSMYKKAMKFGLRHLLIIDECHMVPHKANGTYRHMIEELECINPAMRVAGFTATPYRLKGGDLTDDSYGDTIFTDFCYKISINDLIEKGKLCNIVTVRPDVSYDINEVKVGGSGEFVLKNLAEAIDSQVSVTEGAVDQIVREGASRNKWLTFTSSVKQAQQVNDMIRAYGINSEVVSGETPKKEREHLVTKFKSGQVKSLVNCMLYTTGFDVPSVDMITLLRSTMSAGLYLQMVGRGMRTSPGKDDTLVLDFGGNIERHGPIDNVKIKKRPRKSDIKEGAPMKACPACFSEMPIQMQECPDCGFIFPQKPKHQINASDEAILTCNRRFMVKSVTYQEHITASGKWCLLVKYKCMSSTKKIFKEFICIGYEGFAGRVATKWLAQRGVSGVTSVEEACKLCTAGVIEPIVIKIDDLKKEYPKVTHYEFSREINHEKQR